MTPRRFSQRLRQMRKTANAFHSPPQQPKSLTKSPMDSEITDVGKSPESLRFKGPEPLCIKELSPKILPRAPKLKLNLDIPDEDAEEDLQNNVNYPKSHRDTLERTASIDTIKNEISFLGHSASPKDFLYRKMESLEHQNEKTAALDIEQERCEEIVVNIPTCCPSMTDSPHRRYFDTPKTIGNDLADLKILKEKFSQKKKEVENYDKSETLSKDLQPMTTINQTNALSLASSVKAVDVGVNSEDQYFDLTFTTSPPSKKCITALNFNEVKISSEKTNKARDNNLKYGTGCVEVIGESQERSKLSWPTPKIAESGCQTISVTMELSDPQVIVEDHSIMNGSVIEAQGYRMGVTERWPSLERVLVTIEWIGRSVLALLKKYGIFFREAFNSQAMSRKSRVDELDKVVEVIRKENERIAVRISESINDLLMEWAKTSLMNHQSLLILSKEVETLKNTNKQLLSSTTTVTTELKSISEALEIFKSNLKMPATVGPSPFTPQLPSPLPSVGGLPGLPPPPPPPPPPLPSLLVKTPKTPSRQVKKLPKRTCSTPLEGRPSITLEDILKVTLKKAPPAQKDPLRTPLTAKGPVVSLDMLKSVKLKSARRRSTDQLGSPRRIHPYKYRSTQNLSASPISGRERSPLHRILRQTDETRRGRRKTMSPTTSSLSDYETPREGKEVNARSNRSHSIVI